jgi:hypothetical protein
MIQDVQNPARETARDRKAGDCSTKSPSPTMIQAGASEILAAVGGFDLGGYFSAEELALAVYQAMAVHDVSET